MDHSGRRSESQVFDCEERRSFFGVRAWRRSWRAGAEINTRAPVPYPTWKGNVEGPVEHGVPPQNDAVLRDGQHQPLMAPHRRVQLDRALVVGPGLQFERAFGGAPGRGMAPDALHVAPAL